MRTSSNSDGGKVTYPDAYTFMFSPMPVVFSYTGSGSVPDSVTVTVASGSTDRSFTETRKVGPAGTARFDIARICQELAPELDTLLDGLQGPDDLDVGAFNPCATLLLTVSYRRGATVLNLVQSVGIAARYGSCDPGEVYSNAGIRMVYYCNYPQTVPLYADSSRYGTLVSPDESAFFRPKPGLGYSEVYPGPVFQEPGMTGYADALHGGSVDYKTYRHQCIDGAYKTANEVVQVHLDADFTPFDAPGRYFVRWINRRGELRYRLFYGGDFKTAVSESEGFTRLQGYDEYSTTDGRTFANPDKSNFAAVRTLTLGAPGVSAREFDELTELGASPVVHLLRTDEAYPGEWWWERVNVQAGTYTRNRHRGTPQRMDFEISLVMPAQNNPRI